MAVTHLVQDNEVKLYLGHQGENLARELEFDLSEWVKEYGKGTAQLIHQRAGEDSPYPAKVEFTDNKLTWRVTNADTAISGIGCCELQYLINDVVVKSKLYKTRTVPSLDGELTEIPAPERGWMQEVFDAEANAKESADDAKGYAEEAKRLVEEAGEAGGGVFISEYGKTTFAEVKKAWDEGKAIVCHQKDNVSYGYAATLAYAYLGTSGASQYFTFVRVENPIIYEYRIYSNSGWAVYAYNLNSTYARTNHTHTPESIGAIPALGESIADPEVNIDDLKLTKCYLCGATVIKKGLQGDLPWETSFLLKVDDYTGTGTRAIQTATKNNSTAPVQKYRFWNGTVWSPWQDN